MPRAIEFPLESGGSIVVDPLGTTALETVSRARIERAAATLRQTLTPVANAASDMLGALSAMPRKPDEIEVRFGVALDTTVGAILATGTAGVHLEVTLRWSPGSDDENSSAANNGATNSSAASGD